MPSESAERFMNALQEIEQTGDVTPLVDLFSDDAELMRISGDEQASGRDGARRFWDEYLSAFGRIRTKFTNVIEDGKSIVLEWVSEAEPETEQPFKYQGVSILEMGSDKVQRFRTYYDSAKFLQAMARGEK